MSVGRVGSKGELFPPKELRERLDLKPHRRVLYQEKDGALIVEPVPSVEEILMKPPKVEVTIDDLRALRHELSKKAES